MANFANLLTEATETNPERIALRLDDAEVNYAAFDAASMRVAGMLAERGVRPGDRVGLMLPNVPYFPIALFGILRLGATVVPMNPLLKGREVAFYLSDPEARAVLAWHQLEEPARAGADEAGAELILVAPGEFEQALGAADPVDEVAERDDGDTAVILYTSGTTGTPKGAQLTHGNLRETTEMGFRLFEPPEHPVTLGALPLFHVFGLIVGLAVTMRAGGTLTLLPRFEPGKALEIIARDRVTTFLGVPTMYAALLHHPEREGADVSSLTLCVSGGAAMPVEILRGFEEAFGATILEGYGLSESTAVGTFNRPDRERKPGSIGIPNDEVDLKLVDDEGNEVPQGEIGEIVMRGPNVMSGYWKRPEATADTLGDGWLKTGDMARIDEDGYIFIVDRKKELIIRGGYNVYPRELEEVLYEHPAVREAAVVGMPHPSLGEEVGAAVALKDGAEVSPDELRDYMKEHVAAYKYPRRIWLVDELPKGPTGKILKREVEVPEAEPARGS
jgi:long-chain acyl-CoA synthetase